MLAQGVIEPSTSPWLSPVLACKKDGTHRFYEDWGLHKVTIPRFPISLYVVQFSLSDQGSHKNSLLGRQSTLPIQESLDCLLSPNISKNYEHRIGFRS